MTRHRTADLEPTSFGGRYTLVRRLAVGGMAEIYLAKQARVWSGGKPADAPEFEKEVVIKRLRAELADDPRIVEMFLDEARIGALLNHPNIVHVYDVDDHDGIPYIAMEYIVGEELNELCRRGIGVGKFLPLEHAVELMRQAAAGLGYFHAKRGALGSALADQPLDIVHLDISPSNLLVTQDGFLKVIDFGISRARGRTHHDSVIPGKLSYMSPEQASRTAVDHRSDIFSLGIVLYEITVGKRLFRGAAGDVVEKLTAGKIEPPTFARRHFPVALEAIVMRALERHAEDRYQSAYDLADDLESFLRDEKLHSGPVRIARYLDMLATETGGARRPELVGEVEIRKAEDDLDFDRQAFDGYVPADGAPGPDQAPEWEDAEQSEADVANALGLELAELRALRTPVPMRPSGVGAAKQPSGKQRVVAPPPATRESDSGVFGGETTIDPAAAARAQEAIARRSQGPVSPDRGATRSVAESRSSGAVDVEIDTNQTQKQELGPENAATMTAVADDDVVVIEQKPPRPDPAPVAPTTAGAVFARADAMAMLARAASRGKGGVSRPVVGASMLRASTTRRWPWAVALLGLIVAALVVYILAR